MMIILQLVTQIQTNLGIHGVGDSWPNWHYAAFVAERYGDAETGVLEGDAGPAVTAVRL